MPPPRLSVVIASVNGLGCILECLEKLEALPERDQMELLVLDRRTDDTASTIAARFPRVVLHAGLTGQSIPELRWRGIRAARADLIAVIEDHCLVTPQWAAEILRSAEAGYGVVGGPVENGSRDRLLDWAFFLAEYSPCMPPLAEGEAEAVPGNNAVYRRSILPLGEPAWAHVWESFLQNELRRRGIRVFLNPAMLVYHKKSFRLGEMLLQRFLYSRSFAAMRAERMNRAGRLFYAAASPPLPVLLVWRIFRCTRLKRRNLREFLLGLPVILLFVLSWAAGEMTGYLTGPGDSLARVE
ncbi:MAG TPA: glycosyltransferase [Bryobacterales bacterium]|nr:glycosyltransferase [Bryobacterales bacterium]